MDERRNKIIVGGIIGIVVLAILGFVVFGGKAKCDLVEKQPEFKETSQNIASSDYKSLVNFAGFLKYEDVKDKVFMPLAIQSVKSTDQSLTLQTDCAELAMTMKVENERSYVEKIDVKLSTANGDYSECTIMGTPLLLAETGKHYRCKISKSYSCKKDNKAVAVLTLNAIEFVFNGDAEKIKKGEFGNDPKDCQ